MSIIATAVKHLLAAGVTGDALVQAIAEMEANAPVPVVAPAGPSKGALRMRAYRERHTSSQSVTCDGSDAQTSPNVTSDSAPLDKKNPQTPKRINPPLTPIEADASMPPAGAEQGGNEQIGKRAKRRATARSASSRLAPDWQPPAIADLPQTVQAMIHGWPAGAYEVTAEGFRNHWAAEGRAIGAKRDWAKTWHNWLMRECTAVARAVRAGVSFAPVAPGKGDLSDEERAARFDRTAELFDKMGRPEDAAQQREQAGILRSRVAALTPG